ncbi:deoxyinosine 3'endonuclease (endonuclease V) [Amycolatopsis bartoniae]|uniref:Endonuclease V n=1 Tax=Amycolatopsis bartoniae TaxID=941986 RepID=A0A8H9MDP2_9PSEU|nr:endonuclease V [Amycolatopsis bartoniae]MBB2938408.1 deoxyinosine 3'endonuclease (endonuclease V) [Amycolatopsis bartoniae]TVT06098.1 hypothetical protein FNH07_21415 [Amycolatopsis bartoniae]GHF71242.1 hypothetical protein GCM10017566_51370 [Amycolatopsis bartoniae]
MLFRGEVPRPRDETEAAGPQDGLRPLVGGHAEPGRERGDRSPVRLDGRAAGYAVRTQAGIKPVYVSPGHRVSVETAVELVLRLTPRYRLPEPVRAADHESTVARKD